MAMMDANPKDDVEPSPEGIDWSIFDGVRVLFWTCPEDHPRLPLRQTVEWDGEIATCLDCGRTNERGWR